MANALLEKAQRLGMQPTGTPTKETLVQKAQRLGIKPAVAQPITALPAPKKDFLQKAGDVVNTLFPGKAVGGVIGTLAGKAVTAGKEALGYAPKGATKAYDSTLPTGKQVAGDFISQAAMFAPGAGAGARLATKVGVGAATGYALDVGNKLGDTKKTTTQQLTPGIGTALGATLPIIGAVIGKGLKSAPQALERTNLRMTPVDKQNMARQGKDIVEFMTEKKVVGSPEARYAKMSVLYDDMEKQVQEVVKGSGVSFNKNELIDEVSKIPEKFSDDIAGYDDAVGASDKIVSFLKRKAPEFIPADLLNTYKRGLFKRAYSKNNTDVLNESLHAAGSLFNEKLRQAVPALESLNQEYGNIILAKKILFKATTRPQVGLVGKLAGSGVGAAVGGTIGGGIGAGVGIIAGEQAASKLLGTATRSATGATLQRINEVVSKIPTDKAGNLQIGSKELIRLLQQYPNAK